MHERREHSVAVPSVDKRVVAEGFHLRLRLEHVDDAGELLDLFAALSKRRQLVGVYLFRLHVAHALGDVLGEAERRPADSVVALLLLALLVKLVGVGDEDEVRHVAPDRVVLVGAAHVEKSVLESAPVLADGEERNAVEDVRSSHARLSERRGYAGIGAFSAADLAAELDRILNGAEPHHIAGMHDPEIGVGDVLVLADARESVVLIYGKNAVRVSRLVAKDYVLDHEFSNFQLHSFPPFSARNIKLNCLPEFNKIVNDLTMAKRVTAL